MAFIPCSPACCFSSTRQTSKVVTQYPQNLGHMNINSPQHTYHSTISTSLAHSSAFVHPGQNTFQLAFAFILGGLFFSTALSLVTAFFAIGRENIFRGWNISKAVLARVWNVFTYGLKSTRQTLIEGKQWKWKNAWNVLKEQLTITKQAAAEGIEAIKLEVGLYSSVVGQPGLVALQYFVDNLTKLISNIVRENIETALTDIKNPNVKMMKLEEYNFGDAVPKLMSARAYDVPDAIALDVDVAWMSKLNAKVKLTTKQLGVRVPVTIKNLRFEGVTRIIMTPLTEEPPGFGAVLISFPKAPSVGIDVSLSKVELTKTPWIRDELLKEIQSAIAEQFLWPRRIIIPSGIPPQNIRPMLSKVVLEELQNTDPLLRAERRIDQNALTRKSNIQRDQAKEKDLELDVSVREEEMEMEKEVAEELDQAKAGSNNKGFRLPWQKAS